MDRMYLITVVLLTVWSQLPGQTFGINPTGATCDGICRAGCNDDEDISGTGNCGKDTGLVCCVECTDPWTMINGHCYLFSPEVKESKHNFTQAQAFCQSYANSDLATAGYGGGHDQDPLLAYVFKTYPETDFNNAFYLGARLTGPSTFKWVDGRSLPSTSYLWHPEEPQDDDSQQCVCVGPRYDRHYKRSYLYDVECSNEQNFICEILNQ